ncbi:MAG TPA: creatininase family protein [Nitrospira sp.]
MWDLGSLNTESVRAEISSSTLLLPIGSVEQHGPHLPLTVDLEIAAAIATEVARRLNGFVAPPIAYGARSISHSGGGRAFAGNVFAKAGTLVAYIRDIILSFIESGARKIVIINGHYENESLIFEALEEARDVSAGFHGMAVSWWSVVPEALIGELFPGGFPGWHAEHAGVTETSLMLYLRPDAVGEVRVVNDHPPAAGIYATDLACTNRGVLSTTAGASAAIGRALFDAICAACVEAVQ